MYFIGIYITTTFKGSRSKVKKTRDFKNGIYYRFINLLLRLIKKGETKVSLFLFLKY